LEDPIEIHGTDLIATIAIALGAAFVAGYLARLVGLPSIVGYLLAGVAVGPFTPGLVADPHEAQQLAEIGVALLMFGVGLHFSITDLIGVHRVAVPGAVVQIAIATALGTAAGSWFGWNLRSSLVLGLAISVASTVVLLRALRHRGATDSEPGKVTIGWLIFEDLFTVVALVLLPVIASATDTQHAGTTSPLQTGLLIGAALGKAVLLTALMLVVGSRVLPWVLTRVEGEGSRELFTLAILATAIGIAFASAEIFDVSLALGAFLAGVISGSRIRDRAAADILPLTDVFTVLFFVSVGMLLDPAILASHPKEILTVLAIVVLGKSLAAFAIVVALRRSRDVGRTVAVGLAQIGEFSFIVATAAQGLGMLPDEGFQVIVAVALLSITVNPALFALTPDPQIGPTESAVRS
jgi:CPA2 family monovalent cation:H+ antiporter-2